MTAPQADQRNERAPNRALQRWDEEGGAAGGVRGPEKVQDEHRRGDTAEQSDWARGRHERNIPGAASQPRPAPREPPESAGVPKGPRTEPRSNAEPGEASKAAPPD